MLVFNFTGHGHNYFFYMIILYCHHYDPLVHVYSRMTGAALLPFYTVLFHTCHCDTFFYTHLI